MNDSISIANQDFVYVSVYDKDTGERKASYVTGVHADTKEELEGIAKSNYPDDVLVVQTADEYSNALQNDLLYVDGEYKEKPEPTEEESREQKLNALDSEYSQKISDVETEMAKAQAVGDTDYFTDLKAERAGLVSEYTEKRGEI